MTIDLREELRREAAKAKTYDVYARSLSTARRSRRRAVAVWVLVLAALGLAAPFVPRAAPVQPADAPGPSLPDRIGKPALGSIPATGRPHLGAASAVFMGPGWRFGGLTDDSTLAGLVGATSEAYRTLDVGPIDDAALLSPDGRQIATPDRLVDLVTGRTRMNLSGWGFPLAWSPDGRRLVVGGVRLSLLDIATGSGADLGPADGWTSAAWSPDGSRLAYESDHRIVLADATGRTLSSFVPPAGSRLAGKGAWTPDGRELALTTEPVVDDGRPSTTAAWRPRWVDAGSGRAVDGPGLPAVAGVATGNLLGWTGGGDALVFVTEPARVLRLTPGAAAPVEAMKLPADLAWLDLADDAIVSGSFRHGSPPYALGPRAWLVIAALLALIVVVIVGSRRARRNSRVAAIPWETAHGPLV